MLLVDVSCGSQLVGSCLVQMCGKTGDGTLLVGRWHLLCLVLLQGCADGQGGVLNKAASGKPNSLDSSIQIPDGERLSLYVSSWQVSGWGWLIGTSLSGGLAVLPVMEVEGVWSGWWVVATFVTQQAEPVVHYPKVVDDCPLILSLLPTPGAVSYAIEGHLGHICPLLP